MQCNIVVDSRLLQSSSPTEKLKWQQNVEKHIVVNEDDNDRREKEKIEIPRIYRSLRLERFCAVFSLFFVDTFILRRISCAVAAAVDKTPIRAARFHLEQGWFDRKWKIEKSNANMWKSGCIWARIKSCRCAIGRLNETWFVEFATRLDLSFDILSTSIVSSRCFALWCVKRSFINYTNKCSN